MFLKIILNVHILKCPIVCILESRLENIQERPVQWIVSLAFLSVMRTILMNWKTRKLDCYNKYNSLKEFLCFLRRMQLQPLQI